MKKAILTFVILASSTSLVGCGANRNLTMPNQAGVGVMPGTGTGFVDPNAGYGAGTGFVDPNAGYGAGYNTTYPQTGVTDPYGTGAGYGQTYPQTGAGYGQTYPQTGAGYGTTYPQTGYGTGYGTGTGQPVIDPMTGQPMIDPNTGMPMMNNGMSQQIVSKIQQAGGYRGTKADSAVTDSLKGTSVQQAFAGSPLEHRTLAIKALLDGWCTDEEKNFATQIWSLVMPQEQQVALSSDAELSKLVTSKLLQGKGNGISSVLSEVGKFVGLGK